MFYLFLSLPPVLKPKLLDCKSFLRSPRVVAAILQHNGGTSGSLCSVKILSHQMEQFRALRLFLDSTGHLHQYKVQIWQFSGQKLKDLKKGHAL